MQAVESIVKNAGDYYEFLRGLSGDTSVTVGGSNLLITTRYTYSSIISDAQSLFVRIPFFIFCCVCGICLLRSTRGS